LPGCGQITWLSTDVKRLRSEFSQYGRRTTCLW